MIKLKLPLQLTALTLATLSSIIALSPAKANTFEETPVEQSQFVAVAQPFGENKYNLIVIEQIPNKQTCWSETGSNPVSVDILLLNFDFSGHCRRSTDANGYSIRFNGEDFGLNYILSLVERNGELQLIGMNRTDPRQPEIVVGTSRGMANSPVKIQLNPGWRFTKRTYQNQILGHVYFSYTDGQAAIDAPGTTPTMNQNTPDPNNLDTIPQGTVQDFVAPGSNIDVKPDMTNPPEQIIDNPMPKSDDTPQMMNNNSNFKEKKEVKSNYPKLTMTRFQQMRNH